MMPCDFEFDTDLDSTENTDTSAVVTVGSALGSLSECEGEKSEEGCVDIADPQCAQHTSDIQTLQYTAEGLVPKCSIADKSPESTAEYGTMWCQQCGTCVNLQAKEGVSSLAHCEVCLCQSGTEGHMALAGNACPICHTVLIGKALRMETNPDGSPLMPDPASSHVYSGAGFPQDEGSSFSVDHGGKLHSEHLPFAAVDDVCWQPPDVAARGCVREMMNGSHSKQLQNLGDDDKSLKCACTPVSSAEHTFFKYVGDRSQVHKPFCNSTVMGFDTHTNNADGSCSKACIGQSLSEGATEKEGRPGVQLGQFVRSNWDSNINADTDSTSLGSEVQPVCSRRGDADGTQTAVSVDYSADHHFRSPLEECVQFVDCLELGMSVSINQSAGSLESDATVITNQRSFTARLEASMSTSHSSGSVDEDKTVSSGPGESGGHPLVGGVTIVPASNSLSPPQPCTPSSSSSGLETGQPVAAVARQEKGASLHHTGADCPSFLHAVLCKETETCLENLCPTISGEVSLGQFPDEMLLKVFALFSPVELCRYVAPVCQRWHGLAYDSSLWRRLDVSCIRMNGFQLCQIVRQVPGAIRSLDMSGLLKLSNAEMAIVVENCQDLIHLDVGFVDDLNATMIHSILMSCPRLKFLNVEGCRHANNEMMRELTASAGECLRQLNFSHCSMVDESFMLMMHYLPNLTHLNIDGISWISESVVMRMACKYADTLVSWELDGNELTDDAVLSVSGCRHLSTLSISFCENLTDVSLRHLQNLENLQKLALRKGYSFSSVALRDLLMSPTLRRLTYIDLTECQQLNDEGVMSLAKTCGGMLTTLNLSWCWDVTDKGMECVVQACRSMIRMYLVGLHRLEGLWLPTTVTTMPHVLYISLEQCNEVMDSVIEEAVRDKHDLVVVNYYGEVFMHVPGQEPLETSSSV